MSDEPTDDFDKVAADYVAARGDVMDMPEATEDGVAKAFSEFFAGSYVFDHEAGSWFTWAETHWKRDVRASVFHTAREFSRMINERLPKWQSPLAKIAFAAAVERAARADPKMAVSQEIWDTDPWLLGTPGGVVDLRTGHLRPASQDDYMTKLAAVTPAATSDCPLWLQFLRDATAGDDHLIRFLRQWIGYCLTGDTREHALLFVYGPGGNGKGVFLSTVSSIMADYCRTAAMDTFTASISDKHPTDLAMLRGSRMVCASETEEGRAWAEVRIKQMTGGNDTIAARFMRQDFFEYRPQFKLTIIGNHKPILRNVDDAARRQFNIVPFLHKPPVIDHHLEDKIRTEWPAVLRWAIEGCLDWQANGLIRPRVVLDATSKYFGEQDTLRQWVEECCKSGPDCADTNSSLFSSWANYAKSRGEEVGSQKRFRPAMERLDFTPIKDEYGIRGRGFRGLKVTVAPWDAGE